MPRTLSSLARLALASNYSHLGIAAVLAALPLAACTPTMQQQVTRSIGTLQHVQSVKSGVNADVLARARGIAIVDEGQWALVLGGSHGSGVLMRRLADGRWSAPCAITASGLNIGLSAGGEGRSVVVVFEKDETLDRFVGKGSYFLANAQGTWGGAYGHTSEAVKTGDDVHTYVVAEGLFASAALGQMSFDIDDDVNHSAYGPEVTAWDVLDGHVAVPPGWRALAARLDRITGDRTVAAGGDVRVSSTPPTPPNATVVKTPVETAADDEPAAPRTRPDVER